MYPAFSVIVFTVVSGLGFGLIIVAPIAVAVALTSLNQFVFTSMATWSDVIDQLYLFLLTGFVLASIGLVSSVFHLGRPSRAWKSFSQWRSSWLSREGIFAVLTLGFTFVAAGLQLVRGPYIPFALAAAVLSLVTVLMTGMIYQQLKTVQSWHTPLTSLMYIVYSLTSGTLLMHFITSLIYEGFQGDTVLSLTALGLLVVSLIVNTIWVRAAKKPAQSTAETATGLGALGSVGLLESPHSEENYLLKEFGYSLGRRHERKLRRLSRTLAFAIPMIVLVIGVIIEQSMLPLTTIGFVSYFAGIFIDRWLFFAGARHSVLSYYGR